MTGLAVSVIRSARRTKTAQARIVGETLEVRVPAHLSPSEVDDMVQHFIRRYGRQRPADGAELTRHAGELARCYGFCEPSAIRWVSNQRHRWGSCTPATGTIRLSDRMIGFPSWVVDYVIVHELAHLSQPDHSPMFWQLVERYPLTERARGYLLAKAEQH